MRRTRSALRALLLVAVCWSTQASADLESGLQWLAAQQSQTGAISRPADISSVFQATSEAARAFSEKGSSPSAVSSARVFLQVDPYNGVEYVSRKIIANALTGNPAESLVAELLATQSPQGGFGEFSGHDGSILDTSFALEALAMAGVQGGDAVGRAVGFLLNRQQPNGSWIEFGSTPSVYVTAAALRALWHYRKVFSVSLPSQAAITWLLQQRQPNSLWETDFESAAALATVVPALTDRSSIQSSIDALWAQQSTDGSFGGDVFVTALALRALAAVTQQSPDEIAIKGRVIDGDTTLPLSGATVSLTGAASQMQTTNGAGAFEFRNLVPGNYGMQIAMDGYGPLNAATNVRTGDKVDFGDLALVKGTTSPLATVRGIVTDATTGTPIGGATIAIIIADDTFTATAAPDGTFQIANVPSGHATVTASAAGYRPASGSATIPSGGIVVFSPRLVPGSAPTGVASLQGVVTDAGTDAPLSGVSIAVSGSASASTQTDASGFYRIESITAGDAVIAASKDGYHVARATVQLTGDTSFTFSPSLTAVGQPEPAVVQGVVADAETNAPLSGVSVVISGASAASTQTNASGYYRLDGLSPGAIQIDVTLGGYASVVAFTSVSENTTVDFSPRLYPDGTAPPQPTKATVTGVVFDAVSNEPLSGVEIRATWGSTLEFRTSDGSGSFTFEDVAASEINLAFSRPGYQPSSLMLPVEPIATMDIGQVRLRPDEVTDLLPDLIVVNVDARSAVQTDPSALLIQGQVLAEIRNEGTQAAPAGTAIAVYHDANLNGVYDAEIDSVVGTTQLQEALAPGDGVGISVPVSGAVPFRDAPLSVTVDSELRVIELDESNNTASSSGICRVVPPTVPPAPIVKWHWRGSQAFPNHSSALGPAIVARIVDSNGDGLINEEDDPNVVFVAAGSGGRLTVVSGVDGSTVWQTSQNLSGLSSVAVGDIDGDRLPEIIAVNQNRTQLLAFEHTGALKWSKATTPSFADPRDGIAIADLNADGSPEIIHGRRAYSATGQLLWQGTGDHGGSTSYGVIPIVADINMDGQLEVIAGRTVYRANGTTLWHASSAVGDGFNAIGNFDDDEFPEIVLIASGRLYLYEHTGARKWGPISIPGGGIGGSPTIGDMDGDGYPEIGVAGQARYTVYDRHGAVKWSRVTQDQSSSRTGSSVFDLNGDGAVEVLYADEVSFFIYDGRTGKTVAQVPNVSGTVLEYPVIADIDNDGHAEILVGSNGGTTRGLRAFEGGTQEWMPTRSIWNQHSYHITNVNDDGTIPTVEQHSWLAHNTYRLNTFVDRDPLDSADLTASLLRLVDMGEGAPQKLLVRIGNGGLVTSRGSAVARFYEGDPAGGGRVLGDVVIGAIEPGRYVDIELAGVTGLSGALDLWVVADAAGVEIECDELNNTHSVPFHAATALGQISVSTDAPVYGAGADALLSADAQNTGSVANAYTIELVVEDQDGAAVVRFGPENAGVLSGAQSAQLDRVWNVGATLAGDYILRGVLRRDDGTFVDEDTAPFSIVAPEADASLRVTTDRPVYHTTDRVSIDNLATNLAPNQPIADPQIVIRVSDPSGNEVLNQTLPLIELAPGGYAERSLEQLLSAATEGVYTVTGTLLNSDGAVLATASAQYTVEDDPAKALSGDVSVDPPETYTGEPVQCTDTVTNRGTQARNGQIVRRSLIRLDVEADIDQIETSVDLPAGGGTQTLVRSIDTKPLEPGDYACTLEARIGESWTALGSAIFKLLEPPIKIDASLSIGDKGRVLILLDGNPPPASTAHTEAPADVQRAFLERLLDDNGWTYTIATDADVFAYELRTGDYSLYALFAESAKLDEQVQKELREAVFRGEGLIDAGSHDQRHQKFDPALGTEYLGKHADAVGVDILTGDITPAGYLDLTLKDKALRARLSGAQLHGRYLGVASSDNAALTAHVFGDGRSVYMGFDLLAEAVQVGDDSLAATLILQSLAYVQPAYAQIHAGQLVPLRLTLTNRGIATPGRAVLPLPAGATVVERGDAQIADGLITWTFDLAEEEQQSFTIWLRLPGEPGPLDLDVLIQSGTDPDYEDQGHAELTLDLQASPGLTDAQALAASDPVFKTVLKWLDKAAASRAAGDPERALFELAQAGDEVAKIVHVQSAALRRGIAGALRDTGRLL